MKKYDFEKAKEIIEKEKDVLAEVALGMHEDWFWTGKTIWENGEYKIELKEDSEIAGIVGSCWATPVIRLRYKNGGERFLECFAGNSDTTKPSFFELGVLAGPVQDDIKPIEK